MQPEVSSCIDVVASVLVDPDGQFFAALGLANADDEDSGDPLRLAIVGRDGHVRACRRSTAPTCEGRLVAVDPTTGAYIMRCTDRFEMVAPGTGSHPLLLDGDGGRLDSAAR